MARIVGLLSTLLVVVLALLSTTTIATTASSVSGLHHPTMQHNSAHSQYVDGHLHLIKGPNATMARSLDGTPAAYYLVPSVTEEGMKNKKLMVHLSGGGICYTAENCYERSLTDLGSSDRLHYNIPANRAKGFCSRNSTVNPLFSDFIFINLAYTDGMLYASQKTDPHKYQINSTHSTDLYFRGHYNLKAFLLVVIELSNKYGVEELIWGGDSAGGAGTAFFAAKYIPYLYENIPTLRKAVSMPDSGLFVDTPTYTGFPITYLVVDLITSLGNCTPSFSQKCIDDQRKKSIFDTWKCGVPAIAWNYSSPAIPTFPLQSQSDMWITCNMWTAAPLQDAHFGGCGEGPLYKGTRCPDPNAAYTNVTGGGFRYCNQTQVLPLIGDGTGERPHGFQDLIGNDVINYGAPLRYFNKKKQGFLSGAAVVSCLTHTGAQTDAHWSKTLLGAEQIPWNFAAMRWYSSLGNETKSLEESDFELISGGSLDNNPHVTKDRYRTLSDPYYEANPTCVQEG